MIFKYLAMIFLLFSCVYSYETVPSEKTSTIEVNSVYFLKNNDFSVHELSDKKWEKYAKNPRELFTFPFENFSSYWVKFDVYNKTSHELKRIIHVSYPDIQQVTFFEKRSDVGEFKKIVNNHAYSKRVFNAIVHLPFHQKTTFLIKFDNHLGPVVFNLKLQDEVAFYKDEYKTLIIHGIFVGTMILAMIYFLLAFIIMKRYIYILYVLHISTFVAFQVFVQGYPKVYIANIELMDQLKVLMAMVAALSYALFVVHFFKKKLSLRYKWIIYIVVVIVLMSMALYMLDMSSVHVPSFFAMLEYVIVWFASISVYKQGERRALYIVLSSFILILGTVIHSLAIIFQIIPLYEYILYSMSYANILEVLIILFMFVTYFKEIYNEKEKIYIQKLELEKSFSKQLEKEIETKTLALQQAKTKAEELARIDELTKTLNRRAFNETGEYLMKESKRYQTPLSLVMIDIDYFKKINDTYGHKAGDIVLEVFAKKISSLIRDTDLIARIGGEEFVLLFPHTTHKEALNIAHKIHEHINTLQIEYAQKVIHVTASFGISEAKSNDSLSSLLVRCDEALYKAKVNGRNQIIVQ